MRHRKKFNHLSRKAPHRKAMLANMTSSLILHKRITTTTAKAKALRSFVEPVITRSREDSTHSRRIAFKHLRDKEAVTELFRDIAGKVGERPGGYTRIIKIGNRLGDNADMCIIELVDYNESLLAEKTAARTKTARRRRGGKKKAEQPEGAPAAEVLTEAEEEIESIDVATEDEVTSEDVAETSDQTGEATEIAETEPEMETVVEEVKPEPEAKSQVEETKEEAPDQKTEPEANADEEIPPEEDTKKEDEEGKKEK